MRSKLLQTLFSRLAISIFACFMVLVVVGGVLFLQGLRLYQREVAQTLHQDLADYVVKNALVYADGKLDLTAAEQLFHDLMILGPNLEFYLLSPTGKILAYSTDPNNIKHESISIQPVTEFLSKQAAYPLFGEDPKAQGNQKVFNAAPIYLGNKLQGYLYVILNGTQYESVADMVLSSKMIRWLVWLFLAGGIISALMALVMTGWITRPLRRLTAQVNTIEPEELEKAESQVNHLKSQWQKASLNEIHILGRAFAQLLDKFHKQHKHVLTLDNSRRELIAHISHDLRTPLASLQGYLETWELNKDTLNEVETARYIGIAKSNAQTLSKLVEQLFELAQLESNSASLNVEPVSMAELIHDVMQKFELQAKQKNITLGVTPKDSTFQVVGDVEKLDRVITNLIENALRHTEPGGAIKVNLSRTGKRVSVKVSDTGVGIPSEDLKNIFQPHFKAGNTVRGNTAHGGLGLTITKKLLDLHQANISVSSVNGAGASFEFSLPVH